MAPATGRWRDMRGSIREAKAHAHYLAALLSAVSKEIAQAIDDTAVIREGLKSVDGGGAEVDFNGLSFREQVRLFERVMAHLQDDLRRFYFYPTVLAEEIADVWDASDLHTLALLLGEDRRLLEWHQHGYVDGLELAEGGPSRDELRTFLDGQIGACLSIVDKRIQQAGADVEA